MKISAINGSPKASGSLSSAIIKQMESLLGVNLDTYHALRLVQGETPPETLKGIINSDVLLIVFPLYVDSLSAPLIELLTRLENTARHAAGTPQVYAVCNCGFFESEQIALALQIVERFAHRAGLSWGYGVGIGGGPMLMGMGDNWEKGPASSVHQKLKDLTTAIQDSKTGDNVFVTPIFPRFLYKITSDMSMKIEAKRNGVKNIRARPYKD